MEYDAESGQVSRAVWKPRGVVPEELGRSIVLLGHSLDPHRGRNDQHRPGYSTGAMHQGALMLNKYQLSMLRTFDILQLQEAIREELKVRRLKQRLDKVNAIQACEYQTNEEIEKYNSSSLLSIPGSERRKHHGLSIYLPALIKQDWGHIYNGGDCEQKYYVYCHSDPTKAAFITDGAYGGNYGGQPFYIGKGTGERAFDLNRNQGHGKLLRDLLRTGIPKDRIAKILIKGLSESKAFEIEAKLVYFFGTIYSKTNKQKGILLNLDVPQVPNFVGVMKDYSSNQRHLRTAIIKHHDTEKMQDAQG